MRPEWAYFVGHFEGRPILPGIAHLALVRDTLRRATDPELELVAVESLRLRHVVSPGDVLELEASARGTDHWVFSLRCDQVLASQGRVETGRCGESDPAPGVGEVADGAFPPPAALIPHRGPALMLAGVCEASEDRLVARAVVPRTSAFVSEGTAAPVVALEVAAQAAAAFEALRRGLAGGPRAPRVGYLVGARDAAFSSAPPVGSPVQVSIGLDAAVPPLSTYRFEVEAGAVAVARGVISTYLA